MPTLKLETIETVGKPTGVVAYFRMPLSCTSFQDMAEFTKKAYGDHCVCKEEPKGWLQVSTPEGT